MDNTIQMLSHPCARGLYSDFYRTTSTLPVARVLPYCCTACLPEHRTTFGKSLLDGHFPGADGAAEGDGVVFVVADAGHFDVAAALGAEVAVVQAEFVGLGVRDDGAQFARDHFVDVFGLRLGAGQEQRAVLHGAVFAVLAEVADDRFVVVRVRAQAAVADDDLFEFHVILRG